MFTLERNKRVDLEKLGDKLRLWFIERDWQVRTHKGKESYAISARKAGKLRMTFAACRALNVICTHASNGTKVKIKQGSWGENIAINAAWLAATGGMNLAFTFWSLEVEREFKNYARSVLDSL